MKIKDINLKIYIFAYILILSSTMFARVNFISNYMDYLEIVGYVLIILIILPDVFKNIGDYKILFFLMLLILPATYISDSRTILRLFLMILASKKIEFKKIIKIDFWTRSIMLIMVVLLFTLGSTDNYLAYRDGVSRLSMGFAHPNVFSFMLVVLNMEYLYLSKGKINLKMIITSIISLILILCYANSRTSFLILILFYFLIFIYNLLGTKKIEKIFSNKSLVKLSINLFLIFTLITAGFVYLYHNGNDIGVLFNKILSDRLFCIDKFLGQYKIKLFGNNLLLISTEIARQNNLHPLVLDNAYFHILLRYGILVYFITYYLFRKAIRVILDNKQYILYIIFVLLLIYGFTETYLFRIEYNIFLLYFINVIFNNKNVIEKEVQVDG